MREVPFIGILPVIALVVLAMGAVGFMLLRRGLRGRRVGDHPVCRRCGFDLFGLPDEQARCPECGGDLVARGAVQRGHRQRRAGLVWTGAALLLIFALIVGLIGQQAYREVDWQRIKPVVWLAREARSGDPTAWAELARRAKAGAISRQRAQPLIADALAWQKDLTKTRLPVIGDFVENARGNGIVTDADWQTYARQAPQLSLRWRAKVRKGNFSLPGEVIFGPARAGTSSKLSIRVEKPIDTTDPLVVPRPRGEGGGHSQQTLGGGGGGSSGVYLRFDPKKVDAAPLGKRTTTVQLTAEVRQDWETPVIEWTQDLSADWELVGRDVQTIELVPDDSPELRRQVEKALIVEKLEVRPPWSGNRDQGQQISLDLHIDPVPVPLSYDVLLRAAGREWPLTSISASGATGYSTGGHIPAKANFDARRVDLVFRPSPTSAQGSVDITRMWNGEVIIRDVEVKWPATQPAAATTTRT